MYALVTLIGLTVMGQLPCPHPVVPPSSAKVWRCNSKRAMDLADQLVNLTDRLPCVSRINSPWRVYLEQATHIERLNESPVDFFETQILAYGRNTNCGKRVAAIRDLMEKNCGRPESGVYYPKHSVAVRCVVDDWCVTIVADVSYSP